MSPLTRYLIKEALTALLKGNLTRARFLLLEIGGR